MGVYDGFYWVWCCYCLYDGAFFFFLSLPVVEVGVGLDLGLGLWGFERMV